jgi:hypothetical protein
MRIVDEVRVINFGKRDAGEDAGTKRLGKESGVAL